MSMPYDIPIKSAHDRINDDFAKNEFRKILIAVVILLIAGLSYYFYIRNWTLVSAEKRAANILKQTENLISARMGKIETLVDAMLLMAEYAIEEPDAMFDIACHIVQLNPYIMGAEISFKEFYYPEKGRWFEAYAGYQKGDDSLITKQIGSEEHDYTKMAWFTESIQTDQGIWSDPYYDNAGGKTRMMTYAKSIRDKSGEAVGVISADISIDTLISIISKIKPYPNSFCTLVTESGANIVSPPDNQCKGTCHVFSQPIENRNMVLNITIPDADMYRHFHRSTIVFAILAIFGMLSIFFIAYRFIKNLLRLNEARIREQQIENELSIARSIQESLLPTEQLPVCANAVEICGLQVPAKYVGGDLYDYYVRDNKLLFCIGDISGKGVPAAMLMGIAHSLFRTLSSHLNQPDCIMKALNTAISDNNPDIMFITMFLGILDLDTGVVTYCNAGHNPPIVVRNGHSEFLSTEPSLLLGVEIEAQYTAYELSLAPGDSLFLYTDGLTEAENVGKKLFGEKLALATAAEFKNLTAEEQIKRMRMTVQQFAEQAEQSDDLTLLAIRFLPKKATLTLTNDLNELAKVEPFLEKVFQDTNLDPSLFSQLDLALEEAVANVIMYAYPAEEKGSVKLTIDNDKEEIISIELCDGGKPFNPLQHPEDDLNVSLEERKIGGLGIHLIKEIMDSIDYTYKDGCNYLRMTKKTN